MKGQTLVSIIIPTYNYAEYIQGSVDSVLKQTYQNIEIIVVDDGSTDDTESLLHMYGERIRYIKQRNQGASAARNRGLKEASGDFITFLDADDTYREDNVDKKVSFLEKNTKYDWCYSDWAWVNQAGNEVMLGHEPEVSLAYLKAEGNVLPFALQGKRLGTNVFMFRKSLADKLDGFDEHLKVLEDYDYYLRAAAIAKLGYVDEVLCNIYQHEGSLGTGCDKVAGYLNRLRLHRKIKRLFADELKEAEVKPAWQLQQADLYRNLAVMMLDKDRGKQAHVLLNASLQYQFWQLGALILWLKIIWARVKF